MMEDKGKGGCMRKKDKQKIGGREIDRGERTKDTNRLLEQGHMHTCAHGPSLQYQTVSVPRIRLVIPSRFTNTLSSSSLPVKSSAMTYRSGLTALAAHSMACRVRTLHHSITLLNTSLHTNRFFGK